jgi:hypothetical protein
VLYVVCSFSTEIESPSFGTPTPTNGPAPPLPVKLLVVVVLAIAPAEPSVLVCPEAELSVPGVAPAVAPGLPPGAAVEAPPAGLPNPGPGNGDPNPPGVGELPPIPGDAIPAAVPSPGARPASGCPKNPFTVVFASPTWISRQSSFPVIGSTYLCRRNRILFDFSSCSIDPG